MLSFAAVGWQGSFSVFSWPSGVLYIIYNITILFKTLEWPWCVFRSLQLNSCYIEEDLRRFEIRDSRSRCGSPSCGSCAVAFLCRLSAAAVVFGREAKGAEGYKVWYVVRTHSSSTHEQQPLTYVVRTISTCYVEFYVPSAHHRASVVYYVLVP